MQQLDVRYEGRVQGVGFRIRVSDIARRFTVTGYVRNMSDGSVELLCEGEEAELLAFTEAIDREMARNVVRKTPKWSEISQPNHAHFEIGPSA